MSLESESVLTNRDELRREAREIVYRVGGPSLAYHTRVRREKELTLRLTNIWDEAYRVGWSAALGALRDMPGISNNDGSQPRPEPDYIERAEAVAEVEKLRR